MNQRFFLLTAGFCIADCIIDNTIAKSEQKKAGPPPQMDRHTPIKRRIGLLAPAWSAVGHGFPPPASRRSINSIPRLFCRKIAAGLPIGNLHA